MFRRWKKKHLPKGMHFDCSAQIIVSVTQFKALASFVLPLTICAEIAVYDIIHQIIRRCASFNARPMSSIKRISYAAVYSNQALERILQGVQQQVVSPIIFHAFVKAVADRFPYANL